MFDMLSGDTNKLLMEVKMITATQRMTSEENSGLRHSDEDMATRSFHREEKSCGPARRRGPAERHFLAKDARIGSTVDLSYSFIVKTS